MAFKLGQRVVVMDRNEGVIMEINQDTAIVRVDETYLRASLNLLKPSSVRGLSITDKDRVVSWTGGTWRPGLDRMDSKHLEILTELLRKRGVA